MLQCLRRTAITQITSTALRRIAITQITTTALWRTAITQITIYHRQGLKHGDISRKLKQEGIKAIGRGIAKFLAKCIESGSVARKPGSGRPSKATAAVRTWATRGNVKTQRKYETELTMQRNGTERRTERNVPWNETEWTVLRRF